MPSPAHSRTISRQQHGEGLAALPTKNEDFDEWIQKLWNRMDRDKSGEITRDELNCDQFHVVLKSVIAPDRAGETASVTYARSQIHVEQAIEFCMRKADLNKSGTLSFDEFKAFLRMLRQENLAKDKANLIFALFDLDSSGKIDKEEFTEMYRYFLGHHPTANELTAEWDRLDPDHVGEATLRQYTRWLQTATNPIFRQHAPALEEDLDATAAPQPVPRSGSLGGPLHKEVTDAESLLQCARARQKLRPMWNERFNVFNTTAHNEDSPVGRRLFFSRTQSLPELVRYCGQHPARLEKLKKQIERPLEPQPLRVLSTDTANLPPILPDRHVPGGTMRDKKGNKATWMDLWQPPDCMPKANALSGNCRPGTLLLRCAGKPPVWLHMGAKDYAYMLDVPPSAGGVPASG